ncbi:choice-of-anchor G family protein [Herbiconiux sp. 11R-BC]|uniref:choice-of-anchor G family protein n=1 Tax=Herbiconiux sp. 11R-BC TaxID=3111637 RepID=UPI003C074376
MRRLTTTIGLLSATVLTVALVPSTIASTTASWPDSEWVHGNVGTSSFDCGADTGYATTSFGRFLSGELLGQNLDGVAALEGMTQSIDAGGAVTVTPPDAVDLGSVPPTSTYANPLDVSVLSGIVGLDLTGLTVGLPLGSAGAVNQYSQVSGFGTAAGASGLVNNSGGVMVTPTTPPSDLPGPATIALSDLLPSVAGIADAQLQVGAVAASSTLDWCAALKSALWGDGSVTGVVRDYGVAGLGLQLDSPLLGTLVTDVNSGVPTIQSAVNSLLGTNGLIAQTIRNNILGTLVSGLGLGTFTGNVSLSGLNLTGALGTLLTDPLSDGVVTIDLGAGTIDVDLEGLLGTGPDGLNNLAPNTELVLNAAVLDPIVTRVGDLLDARLSEITNALTTAIENAVLTVDLTANVSVLSSALQIVKVHVALTAPLSSLLSPPPGFQFTVDLDVLGLVSVLNIALGLLGTSVAAILSGLSGLATGLIVPVAGVVTSTAIAAVNTLGSTLAGVVTDLVDALSLVVDALPNVLSVMVNVQPDQAGAPPGSSYTPATGSSSAQYLVSALRIGLADFLVPGDVAHVVFGTASAGPATGP